jgi:magnesium-transporting ATPase (P-type)
MIGMIALRDKNRATVKSAIHYATDVGKMNVRMISGDHKETCQVVALKAGIIFEDDLEKENTIISAKRLEECCGP